MSRRKSLHTRVHRMLSDERSRLFFPVNNVIALVIIVSTLAVILETVPSLAVQYGNLFVQAEYVFLAIFGIEYMLRIWSAPSRVRYILSPLGIIDLIAILPGFLMLASPTAVTYHTLGVLRILRVLRLLRTFRLVRYIIPRKRREQMSRNLRHEPILTNLQIYFFALTCVVIISGTLVYVIEGGRPGSEFTSIPVSMWWAIGTIATVGYGDLVPITASGRIVAGITMIMGLGLTALLFTVFGRILHLMLFGAPIEERSRP